MSNHSIPITMALSINGRPASSSIMDNPPNQVSLNYLKELRTNIGALKSDQTLLISGESIGALPGRDLKQLKAIFDEAQISQRVLVTVRAPFEYFVSLNQQHIKTGRSKGLYCSNPKFRISDRIEQIQEVFPDTEFTPFARAKAHPGGPVAHFLESIGIPPDRVKAINSNEGLSRQAVQLLAYINSQEPLRLPHGQNPNRRPNDLLKFRVITGEKYDVTEKEIEPFEEYLAEQNKWLRKNLGEEYADGARKYVAGEVLWSEQHVHELRKVIRSTTPLFRQLIADYFRQEKVAPKAVALQIQEMAERWIGR